MVVAPVIAIMFCPLATPEPLAVRAIAPLLSAFWNVLVELKEVIAMIFFPPRASMSFWNLFVAPVRLKRFVPPFPLMFAKVLLAPETIRFVPLVAVMMPDVVSVPAVISRVFPPALPDVIEARDTFPVVVAVRRFLFVPPPLVESEILVVLSVSAVMVFVAVPPPLAV